MAMILYFVIPGRTEGANPESRNTSLSSGFRVRRKRAAPE
jgi:hypothetical protein